MTTFNFLPAQASPPFQFQPTLDGVQYLAVASWNLFSQRWYLSVFSLDGVLVVCLPLVGSPPNYDINLMGGYFSTSTMVFREASQQIEVTP